MRPCAGWIAGGKAFIQRLIAAFIFVLLGRGGLLFRLGGGSLCIFSIPCRMEPVLRAMKGRPWCCNGGGGGRAHQWAETCPAPWGTAPWTGWRGRGQGAGWTYEHTVSTWPFSSG
ncbi:hypothetical protein RAA17_11170 [Komagataeibacter rhaeticus]|nr:hypothetical protein [Komagataeibacter rhaeticus]